MSRQDGRRGRGGRSGRHNRTNRDSTSPRHSNQSTTAQPQAFTATDQQIVLYQQPGNSQSAFLQTMGQLFKQQQDHNQNLLNMTFTALKNLQTDQHTHQENLLREFRELRLDLRSPSHPPDPLNTPGNASNYSHHPPNHLPHNKNDKE